jgi:hypothetical protein
MTSRPGPAVRAPAGGAPSLQDRICHLYEHSLVPVREIARLAGITERNVYATVRRRGCAPRMRLGPGGGRRMLALGDGDAPAELDEQAVLQVIAACVQARERLQQTAAVNAEARRRKAHVRQSKREVEANARVLSVLTRALQDLARVDGLVAARESAKDKQGRGEDRVKRRRPYKWKPVQAWPSRWHRD